MSKVPENKKDEKSKKSSWKVLLILLVTTLFSIFANFYLLAVIGGQYVLNLVDSLGGPGALAGYSFVALMGLVALPVSCWKKAGAGRPLAWCLLWNIGLSGVLLGFGPVKSWMKQHGATPAALVLGQDNRLVTDVLKGKLRWGIGQRTTSARTFEGSEPFLMRWKEIVDTLKSATTIPELEPVVSRTNLERVQSWPEKERVLGLKYVRDKIELLEHDAKTQKRKWELYDFEQGENAAVLVFRAYKKKSTDHLTQEARLVKEDGVWKADFTDEISEFKKKFSERENAES